MTHQSPKRHLAAIIAVLGMLFSQLALSAYACPMESIGLGMTMEEAECCQESARATANLCQEHCKDSQAAMPDEVPDFPGFVPAFSVILPLAALVSPCCEYSQAVLSHATSPPLSILNCCFRI